jgi:PAS domain S-box-containing protein
MKAYDNVRPQNEYKDIIENAPDVICQIDKTLCLTYINPIIKELSGVQPEELIGKPITKIKFGDEHYIAIWIENLQKVFATKQKASFEAICTYKNETYCFQNYMRPTMAHDGSVTSVICICRNITDQKMLQDQLAKLDCLNLIGKIAASIAHEVRNPLTTVRGFLQILDRDVKNTKNHEYYQTMIEELDRANSILTEFLSLTKNKAQLLKPANLNAIITSIYPLLKAKALTDNKNIELKLDTIDNILLDEKEIRQLICNLVQNGMEASPANSSITIKTYMDEENVILAVRDYGSGIPKHVLKKLGTPFLTTKENGTGLGLAVCYKIADHHNAVISPVSEADGSTFYIKLKNA